MTFNPLEHPGIPLDRQLRTWRELDVEPIDPDTADPYTRCRIIAMNGIEVEAALFSHNFSRHCTDPVVRRRLAEVRYFEQQQQKAVNWLLPGLASVLETTIGYEQVAVDLTAWVARMEPDPYLTQCYQFGLLEDFDHLYRYANLYELIEHRKAEKLVGELTEIMPGRPTHFHHRHPVDNLRTPYDRTTADPRSRLHALTIMAAEQQTMNYYMNVGPSAIEPIARRLYQEIAMVEEEHVTHYESLVDQGESWWEQLVTHEYNECYLYWSFMETESDPRIKAIWELHLNMELAHLRIAAELMREHEDRDPAEILPRETLRPVTFEPNKEYVREVLATQIDLTTLGEGFVADAHERFVKMQDALHRDGLPPSEDVIDVHRDAVGRAESEPGGEYRHEIDGPHPVGDLRADRPALQHV